jgi:hypothetical protein
MMLKLRSPVNVGDHGRYLRTARLKIGTIEGQRFGVRKVKAKNSMIYAILSTLLYGSYGGNR